MFRSNRKQLNLRAFNEISIARKMYLDLDHDLDSALPFTCHFVTLTFSWQSSDQLSIQ